MTLPKFDYYRANDLHEALNMINSYGRTGKILAGGTDLIVKMRKGLLAPKVVVDVNNIEELSAITIVDGEIAIGSLVRLEELVRNATIRRLFPVLARTASLMGSWQIRNLATVGGNLANASPAADLAPPLLVLGAKAIVTSVNGERAVDLREFFRGPGLTSLKENELLKEVRIPLSSASSLSSCSSFVKLGRREASNISIVSAAVHLLLRGDTIEKAKIALGAVAPTPLRVEAVEGKLEGLDIASTAVYDVLEEVKAHVKPITDLRATAEYRREMSYVVVKRALDECASGVAQA